MQFNVKKIPKSELEVEVTIPFPEFESHVKRAAVLISEEQEIEGFRRGKAPYDIVKNRFGESLIYERAADIAVRKTYPELMERIIAEKSLDNTYSPIGRPEITVIKLAPGNELQYKIKTAVLPEIILPHYKEIARQVVKEKKEMAVSEEEIKDTLNWIRESRAVLITRDRPAQKGDAIEIDFEVKHEGVKLEKGESLNHPFILGQGKFLPGFEERLEGMAQGEKKSFTLTVPENWQDKSLAGKTLDFSVTMKLVQERRVPEANDEFARTLGNFSSVEALKQNIKEGLFQEKAKKEKERMRVLAIDKIAEAVKIDIPEILIVRELDKMIEELKAGIVNMGMKWEDYLLHIKKNVEELKKEWREEAEKRVRIALTLREIAEREKIEVAEEEIKTHTNEYLRKYKSADGAKNDIDPESLREYIKGVLKNEKVLELLEKE